MAGFGIKTSLTAALVVASAVAVAGEPVERAQAARYAPLGESTVGEVLKGYAHGGPVEWKYFDYPQLKLQFVQANMPLQAHSSTAQATLDGFAAHDITASFVYSIELRPDPEQADVYRVHSSGITVQAQLGDGRDGRSIDFQEIDETRNRAYDAAIAANAPVDLLDLPDRVVEKLKN